MELLAFRCKACNHRLIDDEVYCLDETDWLCRKCNQVSIDASRELMGHPPIFGGDYIVPLSEDEEDEEQPV